MKNYSSLTKILPVAGLFVASIFLVGCSKVSQQVQNTVQDKVQEAASSLLSEADLAKITDPLVRKNLVAQANVKAFRTVSSSGQKTGPNTTTDIQINGLSMAMHSTTNIAGTSREMIIIGDTTYVKDPTDNTWWKQVSKSDDAKDTGTPYKVPSMDEMKELYKSKQENTVFKQVGIEPCGSLTCYKYTENVDGDKGVSRTYWFDNKDFLTRKDEIKSGTVTITNDYIYDNISVSAPSPTKDVPEGHSAFEYMMMGHAMPDTQSSQKSSVYPINSNY